MKGVQGGFEAFFARRSEQLIGAQDDVTPLIEASGAGERWMFSDFDSEPTQVSISSGGTVRSVVADVTGAFVMLGSGQTPGEGTCGAVLDIE